MRHSYLSKLKVHRKRSTLTQGELAFLLGLKKHAPISRYESGSRVPDLKTAFAYEAVFADTLTTLFPELVEQARNEVRARAAKLSESIKRGGDNRKTRHKLQQLHRLAYQESRDAACV